MPTLPNMGLITPTLGGDSGQWDDKINAAFGLADAHDHTSGKGVPIRTAAISINADLSFGGFTLTSLGKIAFTAIAAPVSGSKNLFVNSADNELYWRSNAGTNVKLTSGASINTTLVGGIVGDYSTVGAEVAYDDANDRYTFKQQGTKPWARLASGPVRIYEFNTTESVYVEHAIDASLAASYTVTWPAALPSRTCPLTITAAGAVAFDDTARVLRCGGGLSFEPGSAEVHARTNFGWSLVASVGAITWSIPLTEGDQITQWKLWCRKTTNGADTITAKLFKYDATSSTQTQIGATQTNSDNNPGFVSLGQSGLSETVGASDGIQYYVEFTSGGATAANHFVFHLDVFYKRG